MTVDNQRATMAVILFSLRNNKDKLNLHHENTDRVHMCERVYPRWRYHRACGSLGVGRVLIYAGRGVFLNVLLEQEATTKREVGSDVNTK